jgi:platelet-activating factor acetylhydrolase IB subunit alpha
MVLTERQKKDLNVAIWEYLLAEGDTFSRTIHAFKEEAQITDEPDVSRCLLEKKWTSVVRLQKQVLDLQAKLEAGAAGGALRPGSGMDDGDASSSGAGTGVGGGGGGLERTLPRGPAKTTLNGHRAPVTAVAVHPKYSILASASEDTSVKIWDYETAQYERTLKGHTGAVTAVAFDATGALLATSSTDMSAKLWDLSTYTCIKTLKGHDHTLSSVRFTASSDQVVTCSRDQTIKYWEVSTGYCVKTLTGHSDWVKCIAVSVDGELLASGSQDHTIIVWRLNSGQKLQVLRGHEHVVETVCFGRKPASGSSSGSTTTSVFSSAAGAKKLPGSEGDLELKDSSGTDGQDDTGDDFCYLASGSRDRTVRLWDALKGTCLITFTAHENWVRCVVFHPSGRYIISSSDDKSIRVMDIKEERCLRTIADAHAHFVTSLALATGATASPVLVSGSVDKAISVWSCS